MSTHSDEPRYAAYFAGKVLLALVVGGMLLWGSSVVSSRMPGSKPLAWICLGAAFVVLAYTTEQWVKIVTGFWFFGALNAAFTAKLGYLPNDRNFHMHTGEAIASALVLAI